MPKTHPYNLRPRKRYTNYNEKLRRNMKPHPERESATNNKSEAPLLTESYIDLSTSQDEVSASTVNMYRNDNSIRPLNASEIQMINDNDTETEEDSISVNAENVVEENLSSGNDLEDEEMSYTQNYSASTYNFQDLVGNSNMYVLIRSASQSDARPEFDCGDNLGLFDPQATGDGNHNNSD